MSYKNQTRAIIVFGDIHGFSIWEQSVTRPEIEFCPLMNKFDETVKTLTKQTGYFTKNLGDGYMQVIELPTRGHVCPTAISVIRTTWRFATEIQNLIKRSPWPRPDGFRVRISAGHIWKKDSHEQDYVGRHCNMTHKLLRVTPEVSFLCHQSFVELTSFQQVQRAGFRYRKVEGDRRIPDGVLKSDMRALWELKKNR